jgi:hypothetical protein
MEKRRHIVPSFFVRILTMAESEVLVTIKQDVDTVKRLWSEA